MSEIDWLKLQADRAICDNCEGDYALADCDFDYEDEGYDFGSREYAVYICPNCGEDLDDYYPSEKACYKFLKEEVKL